MDKVEYVLVGNISFDYNYYPDRDGEKLKEDINNLINIEDKELVSIIEAFDLNALEKKLLTNNLLIIGQVLKIN